LAPVLNNTGTQTRAPQVRAKYCMQEIWVVTARQ